MDFDDLREYIIGDDSKDIDWKSSIRHGSLLVRRFEAFRRHNVLFVIDSGVKFRGNSDVNNKKSDVALYTYGTLAYLASHKEDDVAYIANQDELIHFSRFRSNMYNLETSLIEVEKLLEEKNKYNINDLLQFAINHTKRKMVIIIISDIDGLVNLDMDLVRRASIKNNLLFVNVDDVSIFGDDRYDIEVDKNIPRIVAKNKKIREIEKKRRESIINDKTESLKKYRVTVGHVASVDEVTDKLIDLLERHNNAVGTRT
jgi:uncharacterized protein (DUF58 family)